MLPEVQSLHQMQSLVRIPSSQDVPLTARVRRLLDTEPFRRLASISQLGMVSLVYPGANHSRWEHSVGVYHNALQFLGRFEGDSTFQRMTNPRIQEAFLIAALVHDLGHWPFCHPIEDMGLEGIQSHEHRAKTWLLNQDLSECLNQDWECDVADVVALLTGSDKPDELDDGGFNFLRSCISGPVDIDKLDYLYRDSLHAGVPYGQNFDKARLISTLCIHPRTGRLAIGEKGKTAAEMMVFARYVMFSEVYWHHAVRAATAMLQRSVFLLQNRIDLDSSLRLDEPAWIAKLRRASEGSVAEPLVEGLFGGRRRLYKRAVEFNVVEGAHIHEAIARKPYWWLVASSEKLAERVAKLTGIAIHAADLLIDAPPAKLEVDINLDVVHRDGQVRSLREVSPVAAALADNQFDNYVKRVRLFVRPDLLTEINTKFSKQQWSSEILEACHSVE
ncbi:MAG: HD domain-containing protein [Rubripirellula sp.]